MILHQENVDCNCHCVHIFGDYALAHEESQPLNNNAPRALDCLYLQPISNKQDGHELYHLQTDSVTTRPRCTPVPITPSIIKQAHNLAELNNIPKGLKITN